MSNKNHNEPGHCLYGAFKPDKYQQQHGLDAAENSAGGELTRTFRDWSKETLAQAAAFALAAPTIAPKALAAINLLPVPIRLSIAHYLMATLAVDVGNAAFGYGNTLPPREEGGKETRVFVGVGVGEGLYKSAGNSFHQWAAEQGVADSAFGWVPKNPVDELADAMFDSIKGPGATQRAKAAMRGRYVNCRKPAGTSLVKALAPFGFCEGFVRSLMNDQAMALLNSCTIADEGEAGILHDGITPEELAGSRAVIAEAARDVAKARKDHDEWHVRNRGGNAVPAAGSPEETVQGPSDVPHEAGHPFRYRGE